MRLKFIPREERFFELFEDAAENIVKGAELLLKLVNNGHDISQLADEIENIEHEGDITTHEIFDRLNHTFITPFDHEDIHELTGHLDDIIDFIEAAADHMSLYEAGEPTPEMIKLVEILLDAVKAVQKAVGGLKDMKNARRILDYCIEIHRLENEGDTQHRLALAKMFKAGDAMHALKWKGIYDDVESGLDKCEEVAAIVESIVVKHT